MRAFLTLTSVYTRREKIFSSFSPFQKQNREATLAAAGFKLNREPVGFIQPPAAERCSETQFSLAPLGAKHDDRRSARMTCNWDQCQRAGGWAVSISWKPPTSPLLHRDVGEPEGGEEALLVLQLGRPVHLLGREAGAERRRRRRRALGLRRGGRGAALPQQPPPLPPLLLHQLVMAAPGRQAKQRDEVQFLCQKEREQKEQRGKKEERISVLPRAPVFGSVTGGGMESERLLAGVVPRWSHPI